MKDSFGLSPEMFTGPSGDPGGLRLIDVLMRPESGDVQKPEIKIAYEVALERVEPVCIDGPRGVNLTHGKSGERIYSPRVAYETFGEQHEICLGITTRPRYTMDNAPDEKIKELGIFLFATERKADGLYSTYKEIASLRPDGFDITPIHSGHLAFSSRREELNAIIEAINFVVEQRQLA